MVVKISDLKYLRKLHDDRILTSDQYFDSATKVIEKLHNDEKINDTDYYKNLLELNNEKHDHEITKLKKDHKKEIKKIKYHIKKEEFDDVLTEEEVKPKEKKEKKAVTIKKTWRLRKIAFGRTVEEWEYIGNAEQKESATEYLHQLKPTIESFLKFKLKEKKGIKVSIIFGAEYKRVRQDKDDQVEIAHFHSGIFVITNENFKKQLAKKLDDLDSRSETYEGCGSGWIYQKNNFIHINISKYDPLKGSSYKPLPEKYEKCKSITNIKNDDNKCFLWSVLAHLHPQKKDKTRVGHYKKYEDELKINNYPVEINHIDRIEKDNELSINVFKLDKEGPIPCRISKKPFNAINLLLHEEHYSLIKDFDSLMWDFTKHNGDKHFCMRCLHNYSSKKLLEEHIPDCQLVNPGKVVLPELGTKMKFKNFRNKLRVPFVIYSDFECITKKVKDDEDKNTKKYQEHIPCGFCIHVVAMEGMGFEMEPIVYRSEGINKNDVIDKYLKTLIKLKDKLLKILYKPQYRDVSLMKPMTDEEIKSFNEATHCHICEKEFDEKDTKIRDHCHYTGFYQGPAHNKCNLEFTIQKKNPLQKKEPTGKKKKEICGSFEIPVFFHNLKGYDSHFIIRRANKLEKLKNIECLALNKEKYISFGLDQLKFLDTYQFMSSSLESLVANLKKKGIDSFKNTSKYYHGEQLDLLTRKGVYPYDYMNSFKKFANEALPEIEKFHSKLYDSDISKEEYEHAKKVWKTFGIKNMGEYHDLYLKSDVLLLADVFESFRDTCLSFYKLDPCHYFTAPGLSWDAMILLTKVELDLLSDLDMHLFVEKGIRGGISVITHRYAKANNKYMLNGYDSSQEESFITYLDANNLYGWAMIQLLPSGGFTWLSKEECEKIDKDSLLKLDDSKYGYFLEVDLEYPKELHDLHNEFPLCPENIAITDKMRSAHCKQLAEDNGMKTNCKIKKLCPNLMDKEKYVIHYKNLQQALKMGLILKKVHRVLKFEQSNWLEKYIMFNTDKRKVAKNDFEKDFFKLMNNSVFGKTMENVRNHIDAHLITDKLKMEQKINSPYYKGTQIIYDENYCYVEMNQKQIKLNKPIYVGFAILELSKTLMYDFHYNFIKNKYSDNAKLLFQDTDSLTYHIKTKDLYQDFYDNKKLFDFSDMPRNGPFFDESNKKVIGKMKCEEIVMNGSYRSDKVFIPISEFVGLRSKMYSVQLDDETKEKKTAKGVKTNVKDNVLTHQDYKNVLHGKMLDPIIQKTIRSFDHEVFSISMNKSTLCAYDDKRAILSDGISSLAYGHYLLEKPTFLLAHENIVKSKSELEMIHNFIEMKTNRPSFLLLAHKNIVNGKNELERINNFLESKSK